MRFSRPVMHFLLLLPCWASDPYHTIMDVLPETTQMPDDAVPGEGGESPLPHLERRGVVGR